MGKNLCLVAAERKSNKNGSIITTENPGYYFAQFPCNSVNDEEHWTIRNKHICSNKNDMCLTVSRNTKDVFVNVMAYEASAKSQQWTVREFITDGPKRIVTMENVATHLCLFEPAEDNKGKKVRTADTKMFTCPQYYHTPLEYKFYFEKVNVANRKNCSRFKYGEVEA